MKKLAKILATVMTFSAVATTMVMPITAKAETSYGTPELEYRIEDAADATHLYTNPTTGYESVITQVEGTGDKLGQKVAKMVCASGASRCRMGKHYGSTTKFEAESGYATFEVEVYVPSGSSAIFMTFNTGVSDRSFIRINSNGTVDYNTTGSGSSSFWETFVASSLPNSSDAWIELAMEKDMDAKKVRFFYNGTQFAELDDNLTGYATRDVELSDVTGEVYFDNLRCYDGQYRPEVDNVKPAKPEASLLTNGKYVALEDLTYDAIKADLMAGQNPDTVDFAIYEDFVGGETTSSVTPGCIAAVSSKNGDYFYSYPIIAPIFVESVSYGDGKITGKFSNQGNTIVSSLTMIFVEKNESDVVTKVYASETQTNLDMNTYTFVIDGFETKPNGDIFFIDNWDNLGVGLDFIEGLN